MRRPKLLFGGLLLLACGSAIFQPALAQSARENSARELAGRPVIWRNPGAIANRDLMYGPGSRQLAPVAPFTFIEEDKSGESPKFLVRDGRGDRWSVKLGPEAQAETVSTRLVWAVGYFAEEAYYFEEVRINGLPRLSRGQDFVSGDLIHGARFEPERPTMKSGSTARARAMPMR